jgi:hypothetical protein
LQEAEGITTLRRLSGLLVRRAESTKQEMNEMATTPRSGAEPATEKSAGAPFEFASMKGLPVEETIRNWRDLTPQPYDKLTVHPYTRCRAILMNGIENNATIMSHNISRMTSDPDVKLILSMIRRSDSQHQQFINWLHPADQTVAETTIGYEQVAVDLTADLALKEPDPYFKQVLDYALLEDFDHLFRYGCLLELIEGKDPNELTWGFTEIKPGRPTKVEHRHPLDEMRKHYSKDTATIKSKMNYFTIVSGEQQTMLYYKSHGMQYPQGIARGLYTEIAEIEQQHVSQYEDIGDPTETPLEKMALMELCEAYLYYSNAQTEIDPRFRSIWERLCEEEMGHFNACARLIQSMERRDVREFLRAESIPELVVFQPQKEYVNHLLETQVDLWPVDMEFVRGSELPDEWASFGYRDKVNAGWVPSEAVVEQAETKDKIPAVARETKAGGADIFERLKQDHVEVLGMFESLTGGDGKKRGDGSLETMFKKLERELTSHSRAEEKVLYDAIKDSPDAREETLEGFEEHHATDLFMGEIERLKAGSDEWQAKTKVLMELFEHHMVEEEGKLFQKARQVVDIEQARAMVGDFEKQKKQVGLSGAGKPAAAKKPAATRAPAKKTAAKR